MNDLISVIVPVYNVDKYLEKCLDSILKQTYKNFELIIVNDGSTDKSGSICDHYKKLDSRVIYYIKKNGGLSAARNYGIDRCNGEYICFIDSDDYIYPNYLKILYENAVKYNADITACTYKEIGQNITNTKNFACVKKYPKLMSKEQFWMELYFKENLFLNGSLFIICWNKLYHKKIFNVFRYKNIFLEDEWSIHHLIHLCNNIVLINKPLYFYNRERIGSLTNDYDKKVNKRWYIATKAFINRTKFFIKKQYNIDIIKGSSSWLIDMFGMLNYKYRFLISFRLDLFFLRLCIRRYINKNTTKTYLRLRFRLLYRLYMLFKKIFRKPLLKNN